MISVSKSFRAMRPLLFFLLVGIGFGQTCRPDQVRVSTQCCGGAAGSVHAQVFIRSDSPQACLLEGVPKVSSFDESGQRLPVTVDGNADLDKYGKGSNRLVLRAGGKAALTVVTAGPMYDQNQCGSRLILDISGVIVDLKMRACGPPQRPLRVFVSGFRSASKDN